MSPPQMSFEKTWQELQPVVDIVFKSDPTNDEKLDRQRYMAACTYMLTRVVLFF